MKLGIIGLSGSGKFTIFEALTKNISSSGNKGEDRIGTIRVPDQRVDVLGNIYKPKKTIYAQVEYFLPGKSGQDIKKNTDQNILSRIRNCDALIHVIKNFGKYGLKPLNPYNDFLSLDQELIFADLVVVEKRLERLELDKKRGKKTDQEEIFLLNSCLKKLNDEIPLRKCHDLASSPLLKGFAFVSSKPMLILFNNEEDDENSPDSMGPLSNEKCMIIRGKLEHELAQMSDEEINEFLSEFNIAKPAADRVIKASYEILGLISFFTVGEDEVRAWTIRKETKAVDAAEAIHSDIKKGFIRAEVLSYNDLMNAGTYQAARKKGCVRLEGKSYKVQDGDIINFRFNV